MRLIHEKKKVLENNSIYNTEYYEHIKNRNNMGYVKKKNSHYQVLRMAMSVT